MQSRPVKIFALIIGSCLSLLAQSPGLSVNFPGLPITPPGTALVQVIYTGPVSGTRPAALQFSIGFPVLAVTGVSCAPGAASVSLSQKQVTCSPINGGSVTALLWGMNGNTMSDGDAVDTSIGIAKTPLTQQLVSLGMVKAATNVGAPLTVAAPSSFIIPFASPCDVNGDGAINVLDVQIVVNEILGITPGVLGDLNGNGAADVVDLERVINVALGGTVCKTGP